MHRDTRYHRHHMPYNSNIGSCGVQHIPAGNLSWLWSDKAQISDYKLLESKSDRSKNALGFKIFFHTTVNFAGSALLVDRLKQMNWVIAAYLVVLVAALDSNGVYFDKSRLQEVQNLQLGIVYITNLESVWLWYGLINVFNAIDAKLQTAYSLWSEYWTISLHKFEPLITAIQNQSNGETVKASWFNILTPNTSIEAHNHVASKTRQGAKYAAFVYYSQLAEGATPIELLIDNEWVPIPAQAGDWICFDLECFHRVPLHLSDDHRISFAFNT